MICCNGFNDREQINPVASWIILHMLRCPIVAEFIGNISGLCDGCSPGIIEMYQDYIDGRRELREINAEFHARYVSGTNKPDRSSCGMGG